jgi:hypothetical protein
VRKSGLKHYDFETCDDTLRSAAMEVIQSEEITI